MNKKVLKYFLSLLISTVILFLLLKSVEPHKIVETLQAMDKGLIAWILVFYGAMLVFRTLRYRILFGSVIPFTRLFGIVNMYNFLNEFLPFRSGELVYLYMIKQAGVSAGKNVSSLIVARLFDFLMIIVLGFGALGFLLSRGLHAFGIEKYVWLFPVILVTGLILFGLFLRFSKVITSFLLRPFERVDRFKNPALRVKLLGEDIIGALKDVIWGKALFQIVGMSLGVWISATVSYWLIFVSLGVPLSLVQMFFVIAFPALALIVPIQGIAHVGTFEAPVIAGFLAVGIEKQLAFAGSLSGHVVIFSLAIASGLVGLGVTAILSRMKRKS